MKKADPDASVCITNEYCELKEAVVGLGSGYSATAGLPWSELMMNKEPLSALLEKENDVLVNTLRELGVKVIRPSILGEKDVVRYYGQIVLDNGYNQAFPRANAFIVANDLIEFELRELDRKADIIGLYAILHERSNDHRVCWYSTPHSPTLIRMKDYPLLDGRDIISLNEKMLIGYNTCGTNPEGFRWMRNTFAFHDVMAVTLNGETDYLSHAISVPRDGLAIVCREAIEGDIPAFMRKWDVIDVPLADAKRYAVCGLPASPDDYVLGCSSDFGNDVLANELRERGINVHKIDFSAHMELGGSVKDAVLSLVRAVQ